MKQSSAHTIGVDLRDIVPAAVLRAVPPPKRSRTRVLLADDHLLVREGVSALIEGHEDLAVVGTCGDFDGLLAMVDHVESDVLVTDICMPPTRTDEGIRAAGLLRTSHPHLGVIVLSQFVSPQYALDLLDGGAAGRGYLPKDRVANHDQLPAAIRTVAAGGSAIDATIVDLLIETPRRREADPLKELTTREHEVLRHLAQGKSNAAIGSELYLGERAVEKHINSILAKLGLFADPDVNRRVTVALKYLAANGRCSVASA